MTAHTLNDFIKAIPNFYETDGREQADYVAYFLTRYRQISPFAVQDIVAALRDEITVKPYSRLAQYLSEEAQKKSGKYLKASKGYKVSGATFAAIGAVVENTPEMTKLDADLAMLMARITDPAERTLLAEAAKCYQVKSNRAAMVLIWLVVVYRLQQYVYTNQLTDFNNAVTAQTDRRIRPVNKLDDFADIKEVKFIELMRSAHIISNDIRKILRSRLDERNSAAHPSTLAISTHKTVEFGQELIANVLLNEDFKVSQG